MLPSTEESCRKSILVWRLETRSWGVSETSKWRWIIGSWIYGSGNQWKDSDKEYKFGNYNIALQCLEAREMTRKQQRRLRMSDN